jgi:hypothetical protein
MASPTPNMILKTCCRCWWQFSPYQRKKWILYQSFPVLPKDIHKQIATKEGRFPYTIRKQGFSDQPRKTSKGMCAQINDSITIVLCTPCYLQKYIHHHAALSGRKHHYNHTPRNIQVTHLKIH